MRRAVNLFALYPLVTASALSLAMPALAQPARPAPAAPVAWRTDYNAARKEAAEKGLPLLVIIGTDDCFYCRKLEAGPLKAPEISSLIADNFVALKLDATFRRRGSTVRTAASAFMVMGMTASRKMMSARIEKPVPIHMTKSGRKATCGVALSADRNGSRI